ncbi:MAG: DUF3105 domain-containing protein [Actinobacteria bacterium]|nr:DUF3105 domain-containing protein [Actinomycetota bacterium]
MAEPHKKKRNRSRHDPSRAQTAAQREEAKRRLREERRVAALAEQKKQKRKTTLKRWGRYAVIGGAVTAVSLWVFRPTPEVEGVTIVAQANTGQIVPGDTFDYGTATPTSGGYYKDGQACGIFDEEITAEQASTDVYYGAVVLWYQPELPAADLAALLQIAAGYDSHVVVSPQAGLESPIVATSWRRLMEYDSPDGVGEFLDTYRKRSPEVEACPNGA